MKKLNFLGIFTVSLVLAAIPCHGNLVSFGDFSAPASINSSVDGFNTSSGTPLDTWIGNPTWQIVTDGNGVGGVNTYARHVDNSRVRLFQVIDASGISPGEYFIDFDYIYQDGYTGAASSSVCVLGVNNGDPNISRFPMNNDGFPPYAWNWDVLFFQALAPPLQDQWVTFSDLFSNNFMVLTSYDYWALVFSNSASLTFAPYHDENALRAIDNVNLDAAPVPEPSSLLLLGAGLFGFASFYRRSLRR